MSDANFHSIFWITAKVLGALALISLLIAVGIGMLGGVGAILARLSGSPAAGPTTSVDQDNDEADALRTTMPKSAWDIGMLRAVKGHCFTEGMNRQEIEQALGAPTKKEDYSSANLGGVWTWELPPGKCVKYDGENCVEHERNHGIVFFSPKGNVVHQSGGCQTLDDRWVYLVNRDLFRVPSARELSERRDMARAEKQADEWAKKYVKSDDLEIQAQAWHTQDDCEKNGFAWKDGCHAP